ncbi:MAG: hypothetical protein ACRDVG_06130 [Jatrophihabitantaceae bacterium]
MSDTSTADLSSLLTQLHPYCADGTPAYPPSPDEAIAIYSVAVGLVESRVAAAGDPDGEDRAAARDVLIGTRRMLRAALTRVEAAPARPRLMVVDDGGLRPRRRRTAD